MHIAGFGVEDAVLGMNGGPGASGGPGVCFFDAESGETFPFCPAALQNANLLGLFFLSADGAHHIYLVCQNSLIMP